MSANQLPPTYLNSGPSGRSFSLKRNFKKHRCSEADQDQFELAVDGGESRVWAVRSKDGTDKLAALAIPSEVIARFS
jgi:hypothetical protein